MKTESGFTGIAKSPLRRWWANSGHRRNYIGASRDEKQKYWHRRIVLDWLLVHVEGVSSIILADEDLCENPDDFNYSPSSS